LFLSSFSFCFLESLSIFLPFSLAISYFISPYFSFCYHIQHNSLHPHLTPDFTFELKVLQMSIS
jgi:hypothetical protein